MSHLDWRAAARRRLPRTAFDFIDGGADDEVTLGRNEQAFADLSLIPRVLRGTGDHVTATTEVCGQQLRMPLLLAPCGSMRIAGPAAELAQVRGAAAAGTTSVLSGLASMPVDKVAASVSTPPWFQLYAYRDRDVTRRVVERVQRLGYTALVLTADCPVAGNRERDVRNGLTMPIRITPRTALDAARRPRWTWHYLRGEPMTPHLELDQSTTGRSMTGEIQALAAYVQATLNPEQTWEDLSWLRTLWDGPLLLKGVLSHQDAALAVDAGCDGVIVSNHGGRQLDGVPASVEVLPEVVAAVAGRAQVLLDGGVRRGTDVVKALSLGANACLIGRPWVYGLAAAGEAGVTRVLEDLHTEIIRALHLVGVSGVDQLGPELVRRRVGTGLEPVRTEVFL